MKYIFSGKIKKNDNFTILYDQYGRIFDINKEASAIFEKLLLPQSISDLIQNNQISKKKLQDLLLWGIRNHFITVYTDQKNNQSLDIYNTPNSVAIYPTYLCNQRCKFCYTDSGPCKDFEQNPLTNDEWSFVIDKLIQDKITSITLLGGEPFLDIDFVFNVLEKCKDEILVRIFTNGTVHGGIDKELAQKLSRYKNCEIIFSIHSHVSEDHDEMVGNKGALKKLLDSADNIKNYTDIILSASTAVTKYNVGGIKKIAELLVSKGFNSYDIKPFSPSKRVENFMDYFPSPIELENSIVETSEYLKDKNMYFSYAPRHASNTTNLTKSDFWGYIEPQIGGCIGDNEANIDPWGNVYRCPFVLSDENYKIFNILESDFSTYWSTYKWKYTRTAQQVKDNVCLKCDWLDKCHGGCSYLSELFFGETFCGDPYCPKVYKSNLEKENK